MLAAIGACALVVCVAPAAMSATKRGPATGGSRATTVRGACAGAGLSRVTVEQGPDDYVVARWSARGLPPGELWDGYAEVKGGARYSVFSQQDSRGRVSAACGFGIMPSPHVTADYGAQDGSIICRETVEPDTQEATMSCPTAARELTLTAIGAGDGLAVASRLGVVKSGSGWTATFWTTSPRVSDGAERMVQASDSGLVRARWSAPTVVNRSIRALFANPAGKGCSKLSTHRMPQARTSGLQSRLR